MSRFHEFPFPSFESGLEASAAFIEPLFPFGLLRSLTFPSVISKSVARWTTNNPAVHDYTEWKTGLLSDYLACL